jgi:putative membrane protein
MTQVLSVLVSRLILASAVLMFLSSDVAEGVQNGKDAQLRAREGELVGRIHMTNQMEIRAGHLAKSKGTTTEVKRYGDRLVRDHWVADRQLMAVARSQKISMTEPSVQTPQDEHQRMLMERLEQADGPEFDQAFILMMSHGHESMVQLLHQAREELQSNSPLRTHLNRVLPILDQHHQIAVQLERKFQTASG